MQGMSVQMLQYSRDDHAPGHLAQGKEEDEGLRQLCLLQRQHLGDGLPLQVQGAQSQEGRHHPLQEVRLHGCQQGRQLGSQKSKLNYLKCYIHVDTNYEIKFSPGPHSSGEAV